MTLISVRDVSFSYGAQRVLQSLSFDVPRSQFLAILGANGSGKTTLLHLLAGLLALQQGTIVIDGKPIQRLSRRQLAGLIALVRQDIWPAFDYSVYETVLMARFAAGSGTWFETAADRDIVHDALVKTDTLMFAARRLHTLSGGERQRVFIARALAQQTPILLLDEPTNHLDLKHQFEIFELLRRLQCDQQKTIIVVSHDIYLAQQYASQFLLLGKQGRFCLLDGSDGLPPTVAAEYLGVGGIETSIGGKRLFLPQP